MHGNLLSKLLPATVSVLLLAQPCAFSCAAAVPASVRTKTEAIAEKIEKKRPKQTSTAKKMKRWCAHRGYSDLLPENTAPAFILAGRLGAYAIEADVQMSKNKEIYMSHSAYADAECEKPFRKLDSDDVGKMEVSEGVNKKLFKGLRYCTLADYLNICRKYGCVPIIDLKPGSEDGKVVYTKVERRDLAEGILSALKNSRLTDVAIVASSSPEMIHAFRNADKKCSVRVAAMNYTRRSDEWNSYGDVAKEKNGRNSVWRWMVGRTPEVNKHFYDYNPDVGEMSPNAVS